MAFSPAVAEPCLETTGACGADDQVALAATTTVGKKQDAYGKKVLGLTDIRWGELLLPWLGANDTVEEMLLKGYAVWRHWRQDTCCVLRLGLRILCRVAVSECEPFFSRAFLLAVK